MTKTNAVALDKDNALDQAMDEMGCFETKTVTQANTEQFMAMARDSLNRNQGPKVEKLKKAIDPNGIHVMIFQFPHNDVEWRTVWFVKLRGKDEPIQILMDIGFDCFRENTTERIIPQVDLDELADEQG